jgi:hypothetical protein
MTHDAIFRYTVHCSITGVFTKHASASTAARAYFNARSADRPCVIRTRGRAAGTIARTMRIGDQFVKSLPYETDPEFTDAFLNINERCPA